MSIAWLVLSACLSASPSAPPTPVYAILDVANEKGEVTALSSFIGDELSLRYATDSGFALVERGQLRKVMKEQGFQASGSIDEATATSLGKILGASRIITGQYYQMGDEYVAMVRVLDVTTAKVLRMSKVTFPKSSSTQALAQTVLEMGASSVANAPKGAPSTNTAPAVERAEGPLVLERCQRYNFNDIDCRGTLKGSVTGRLQIGKPQAPFFTDNGLLSTFERFEVAGVWGGAVDIPAGTSVPVSINFNGKGKRFRDFRLVYSFAGKEYVIEGPRPIE
jgi:hypothetical protein